VTDRDPTADRDPRLDPAAMRKQYRVAGIDANDLAADPMTQFGRWFEEAAVQDLVYEPNAMVVSTADAEGRPSSRTVLMKHYDDQGFVFYTNYDSRKARELGANPYVSLLFPWHPMARQVLVTGTARRTGRDETAAYFRTRPHGSQLGAWASTQSTVIPSRAELESSRCRRTGAASASPRRRSSSGRAARTACTTACATSPSRTGPGEWSGSVPEVPEIP